MQTFNVELEGITALLHHKMTPEELLGLLGAKEKIKKAKEVLTPRQIAEKHVYKLGDNYVIPLEYIRGAFIQASSDYKQSHSSRKSLKSVAGGAFRPLGEFAVLLDENDVPVKNFEVDIRKGTNHQRGAVCVCRPRFDRWKVKIDIELNEDIISEESAQKILEDAGRRVGIGSFRVSKGGYFGQFQLKHWKKIQ